MPAGTTLIKKLAASALATSALLAGAAASCSSESTPPSGDSDAGGARSACSTGPARDESVELPMERKDPAEHFPACKPRCEYQGGVLSTGAYPLEALPNGSCQFDGERCGTTVERPCACGPGPSDGVWCECRSGQWACMIDVKAKSACGCDDGGADAADASNAEDAADDASDASDASND